MDTLLSAAHLRHELGEELFVAIVSSDNTAAVRTFAQSLIAAGLPTEITIAGVTYLIPHCLEGDEPCVNGDVFVERAEKMPDAALGESDCRNLLDNQGDIPVELRGKVAFIFTKWRRPDYPRYVAIVYWDDDQWVLHWGWLGRAWDGDFRVLRRK